MFQKWHFKKLVPNMQKRPPKFATRLLRWFCHSKFIEELEGDLEETFERNLENKGSKRARLIYVKEVVKLMRPSVIKAPRFWRSFVQLSLFQIHLKLALRNLWRNKVFSAVNIFGLAAAITVGLFALNILYTGLSLDSHHNGGDRLFRINSKVNKKEISLVQSLASTPPPLVEKLRNEVPEVEAVTRFRRFYKSKNYIRGTKVEWTTIAADEYFFDIFNFRTIYGNAQTALANPGSIIITKTLANRHFPQENPVGKILPSGEVIRAVIESPTGISHLDFDVIRPLEKVVSQKLTFYDSWEFFYQDYTYLRLADGISRAQFDQKLQRVSNDVSQLVAEKNILFDFTSQGIRDIAFGPNLHNEPGLAPPKEMLHFLSVVIIILLVLASFNYSNLSIARAIQRTKEIGIRKVVGSNKGQIVGQILVETVVFSMLGAFIGFLVYKSLTSTFTAIATSEIGLLFNPNIGIGLFVTFLVFSIGVGLFAGFFPALFFARISPLSAFRPNIKTKSLSLINIRKVLVVFQLSISMICIIAMLSGLDSYKALLNADYGFEREGIVTLEVPDESIALLKTRYEKIVGVEAASIGSSLPGVESLGLMYVKNKSGQDSIQSYFSAVDVDFQKVFKPRLFAGAGFKHVGTDSTLTEVWVNRKFLSSLGVPLDSALGYTLRNTKGVEQYLIVGITEGYIFDYLDTDKIDPVMIIHQKFGRLPKVLSVKLASNNWQNTLERLEEATKEVDKEQGFKPKFLNDSIKERYSTLSQMLDVFSFLAAVIICISLLGQLGMALYNAETRVKEIGIRKVLGAQTFKIIFLLLKGTLISLTIASLIGIPLAYIFVKNIFWNSLVVKVNSEAFTILKGVIYLATLVVFIVIIQTWRVASSNPAQSLRNE